MGQTGVEVRGVPLADEDKQVRPDAVAIYVRWSTDEQGEGTTLDEQLERCKNYVLSQGWDVNDSLIFVDDGYSGANLERPGITRLRALVRANLVDCVVSLKIDRLSRSLVDCVDLVLREWAGVCYYKSVSQPVNTTDELGRVFFAILAGFAEYERALIRERTFSGLLRRVTEGAYWGGGKPPYGYRRAAKGRLAVNETEAEVVRGMFRMAAGDGLGPTAIASRLNDLHVPGPAGSNGWWPYTVRSILKSRIYIGYPDYGKRRVVPRARTAGGGPVLRQRQRPLVEAGARRPELVLVTDAEHAAAQRLLAERAERTRQPGAGGRSEHLLTGLARCRCGGPLVTGYDRLGRRYYRCQNRSKANGAAACTTGGGFVYADQIEPAVAVEVRRRYADPATNREYLGRRWAEEQADSAVTAESSRRQLAELAAREGALDEELRGLIRKARRGEITIKEKRAFEADLEAERQELAQQRGALQKQLARAEAARVEFEALVAWLGRVDAWDELPRETQKELLRHLVERLVVFKPKGRGQGPEVDIFWRV